MRAAARRRAGALGAFLLAALWPVAGPAQAPAFDVAIVHPPPGQAVFGSVELTAEPRPADAAVVEMEFFVDDRPAGRRTRPPWSISVDVGEANIAHSFAVVARSADGQVARARTETMAIAIEYELNVHLQQLYVTVTRDGQRVGGLEASDFTVLDGGRRQELQTFARGDLPFSAVMLVDASTSMAEGRLQRALAGARSFARRLRPLDRVKLILFSDRRLHETPFTNLASLLVTAAGERGTGGGTALNDMLFLALHRLAPHEGRKVVLLLTDGVDVESVVDAAQLGPLAARLGVLVYWVRLPRADGEITTHWRDPNDHRAQRAALTALVTASGGRQLPIASPAEAEAAFTEILAELREQYVLGYQPNPPPQSGTRRRVSVRVREPGLVVQAADSYIAP